MIKAVHYYCLDKVPLKNTMKAKSEKMHLTRADLDAIPDKYLATIVDILMGMSNDTVDLSTPQIRTSVTNIYPLFIAMYAVLALAGTLTNCGMIYHIVRNKLYGDPTYAYLINIAISDVIKCVFVLPITLAVLLVQNWIFGKFLCFFLPMLQDMPIHVSMMTYLLIAGDRYRLLSEPGRPRIPAFVCAIGSWFFAVCIVLPHPIYTTYLDLEPFRKQHFQGIGICVTNLTDDIQQYMRGLFLLTYIAPLAITAYVYVKASRELQTQEGPLAVAMFEARTKDSFSRHGSTNTSNEQVTSIRTTRDGARESGSIVTGGTVGISSLSNTYDLYDVELNVCKEKRTQKYLIFMVSVFAVLFCPLMVLKLAKVATVETYENTGHFDIMFTMFVWLGFTSTVTTPIIYSTWQMSRPTKERIRSYFRYSNHRLAKPSEDIVRMRDYELPRQDAGLANVGYAQTAHVGIVAGNNRISTGSRGSTSLQSPVLGCTNSYRANLV